MNIQGIKKHLFTGFILLLPLVLTFWIISFLIDLLTTPFLDFTQKLLSLIGLQKGTSFLFLPEEFVLTLVSKVLIIVFLFVSITFVGVIARHFFFRSFMKIGDTFLRKIPVISGVYKTSQELINTIFSENRAFTRVVLVPYPHETSLAIGLVTRSDPLLDNRISVFIPTTPNPTSGYLIFYKKEDVIMTDMKVDEALRFLVSCGVLLEDSSLLKKSEHA